jgi:uncharacterized protein YjbI with pentapeptide repeats
MQCTLRFPVNNRASIRPRCLHNDGIEVVPVHAPENGLRRAFCAGAASLVVSLAPLAASAESNMRLPPLDTDPNRCQRAEVGNTIGQANAVSDKVLDLRMCNFSGKNLSTKTLSGALLADAVLKNTNLQEVVMSKAYAVGADFTGADLTNAIVDRVVFDKANLTGVQFVNAVITGATFEGADLSGANFEDALIGFEDAKRLCKNPTVNEEMRQQIGCRGN